MAIAFPTYPVVHHRTLVNLALNKPASASSEWNADYKAANGNDGNMDTYWAPKYPKDTPDRSWWQVDLQSTPQIVRIELATTRPELPLARYNFEIQASNDVNMEDYIVLGKVGSCENIPGDGIWVLELPTPVSYRYLRAMKTVKERNIEIDFAIADFRVIGY